jgi:cytochrome c553
LRFILFIFFVFTYVGAQTSYEKGKELYLAKACYACHGHKLEGIHNYPMLANRAKGFLSYKLKYFRARKADTQRQEMMIAYAVDLSDEDIDDLTTYFSDYVEDNLKEKYDDSYQVHGDGGS